MLYRDRNQDKGNETANGGINMALQKETKERLWVIAAGTHAALLAVLLIAKTFITI